MRPAAQRDRPSSARLNGPGPAYVAAIPNGHIRLARVSGSTTRRGSRVGGDHRCRAFVDGGDDLGAVDPAQVSGRDSQVGMPELSLDHEQ